jgi:xanthine dehydrogenase small subunit
MRKKIVFYLNGVRKELGGDESSMMLAEYLRYEQGLTGTKIVCAEGDCGACSVLKYFPHTDGVDTKNFLPMNSCITLVAQLDGSSIITVEALKNQNELHEIQKAMVSCHGSQCGFCTPGFVMALAGMAEEKISQNKHTIKLFSDGET